MDACEFIGPCDGSIDAFVKHPPPLEFAGNNADAIGPLGIPDLLTRVVLKSVAIHRA
jgi:hypothetical protein